MALKYAKGDEVKAEASRVTGGFLRGREIMSPLSDKTHPMGSRERLAILNSIGPDINGARVLDLFAGTGALGIESISRGAAHSTFVENNHKTAEVLKKNLKALGVEKQCVVIEKDVEKLEIKNDFDFVFIDPPYDKIRDFDIQRILEFASGAEKIILSHPSDFEIELGGYSKKTKTYAGASITFFTK